MKNGKFDKKMYEIKSKKGSPSPKDPDQQEEIKDVNKEIEKALTEAFKVRKDVTQI